MIARLFLVSDILHNASASVPNASSYRSHFLISLPEIFASLHETYRQLTSRMGLETMKQQVTKVLHIWQAWSLFPLSYVARLERTLLYGSPDADAAAGDADLDGEAMDDVDGELMDDEDGEPMETDTEILIGDQVSHRQGWRAGMLVGAAGVAALMGTAGAAKWAVSSSLSGLQGKEERIDIKPSFAACSKSGENCVSTGCCQVSGHTCFTKKGSIAQCNETCAPGVKGFTCGVVARHSVPVETVLGQRLYCFSVYTKNTGSPKPSTELDLLTLQSKHGASIFACEQWDVFSDVVVP